MIRRRDDRLYWYIIFLFLLVLTPSVVLGIYSYFHTERTALLNAEQTIERQVVYAVSEIDKRIEDVSAIYQVLLNNVDLRMMNLSDRPDAADVYRMNNVHPLFSNAVILNEALVEIFLYTGDHKVVSSSGIYPADYYFGDYFKFENYSLDTFKSLLRGKRNMKSLSAATLTRKTSDRYTSSRVIPMTTVINVGNGKDKGLLAFVVNGQFLMNSIEKYVPYEDIRISVFSKDGLIIGSDDLPKDYVHFGYQSTQNSWKYNIYVSRNEITVTSRRMLTQVLLIIVSVLTFGFVMMIFVSRYMYQPLRNIQTMLKEQTDLSSKHVNSLELLEHQVSNMMENSTNSRGELQDLARNYAETVFLSQNMTDKKAGVLETLMTKCLGFHGGPYQCAAIQFDDGTEANRQAAVNIFGRYFPVYTLRYAENIVLFIFENFASQDRAVVEHVLKEISRALPGQISGTAVGGEIEEVGQLHKAVSASLTVLRHTDKESRDLILFTEDFNISNQYTFTYKDEWALIEHLQRNEGQALHRRLDDILLTNYEKSVSHHQMQNLFEQVRNTAYRYAQHENIVLPAYTLDRSVPFDIARNELHVLYGRILEKGDVRVKNTHIQLVNDADMYINKHYAEDIYLESIAAALDVSAKHLSKIYKQYKNVNISDEVTSIRVEEAKRMLAQTDMTIAAIMEKTGFVSRATFLRSFKKLVEISPSAFRMLHNPSDRQEDEEG